MATAAEDRLNIRRNPHTSFAAVSDCRTIAIYEYTAFCNGPGDVKSPRVIVTPPRLVGQGKDQETKPVLHFKGTAKPMILNKTNAIALDTAWGDTDNWGGKKVRIGCVETTYGGRAIDGIRLKPLAADKPTVDPEFNDEVGL